MASSYYRYESLSHECFRLFCFQSTKSGLVEIYLFEADLRTPPAFEAISYAWGDERTTSTILCNGQHLRIPANVEVILRRLRQQASAGTFWIDSICINQDSIPERNIQVPKMRSIYSEARLVWIWLGEGTDEIEIAFSFLVKIAAILEGNDASGLKMSEIFRAHDRFKKSVSLKRRYYDAVDTNFIVDVLNLPWFHRTWPIQELVLASKAVLVYGDLHLPWQSFITSLRTLQNNELMYRSIDDSLSNPASYYDDTECYRILTDLIRSSDRNPSISAVLGVARSKLSTKPEDKVYGLYGIFDHSQFTELPRVDYNRPVNETYARIATAAIKSEDSLDILYHVCLPQLIPNLPSWVPDWSNSAYFRPILVADSHASGFSRPSYSFTGRQLSVKGIIIDSVQHIAPSTSIAMANFRRGYNAQMNMLDIDKRYQGVLELVRTLQAWIRLSEKLNSEYPTDTTPREAFYNVLIQNAILYSLKSIRPKLYTTTMEQWLHIMTATDPTDLHNLREKIKKVPGYDANITDFSRLFGVSSDVERWPRELQIRLFLRLVSSDVAWMQHEIFLNSYHKTLILTREGYIGTCPRWVEMGDQVALISGLRTPFIVREDDHNYRLIGPAYIKGMMGGEKWDEEKARSVNLI